MTHLQTTISGSPKRTTQHKLIILFALLILFILKVDARAEELKLSSMDSILSSRSVLSFADALYEDMEYYRAITEYKRFIFLFPESPLALNASYKIGLSYLKGKRYRDAADVFLTMSILEEKNEMTKKSLLKLAEAYSAEARYEASANSYERFLEEYPDSFESDSAKYKLSWSYLYNDEYEKARKGFSETGTKSPFYPMSKKLAVEMDRLENLKHKSPALAGTLSAVLPGAGQLYCGRYQDATASFLLNGLFIWGTIEMFEDDNYAAGGVLAFFSLMWYSGNVFGAVSSAHKFNRDIKQDTLKELDSKYNISLKTSSTKKTTMLVLNMRF